MDADVVVAAFPQAVAHRLERQLGPVAVGAEVAQEEVFQLLPGDLEGQGGGGLVGEVAVAGERMRCLTGQGRRASPWSRAVS